MGTNVAGLWQKAAKLLQDSTRQTDSAGQEATLRTVHGFIGMLYELPTPPKAVWKKLVQQLKVRTATVFEMDRTMRRAGAGCGSCSACPLWRS